MNRDEEKLLSLVQKMNIDSKHNLRVLKANSMFIKKFIKNNSLLNTLVTFELHGTDIYRFLNSFMELYDNTALYNQVVLKTDDEGNNFLLLAVKNCLLNDIIFNILDIMLKGKDNDFVSKVINHKNNLNETFVYKYIEDSYKSGMLYFPVELFNKYNFDFTVETANGKSILSFIKGLDKEIKNSRVYSSMIVHIYKKIIPSIIEKLNGNKEHDIEIIENIFGDVNYTDKNGSLLHYCIQTGIGDYIHSFPSTFTECTDKEYILTNIRYLLEIGVDPNFRTKDSNESFIDLAIKRYNKDYKFVISLIELAKQYNYKLDVSLIRSALKNTVKISSSYRYTYEIYKYLSINGLKTLDTNLSKDEFKENMPFIVFDHSYVDIDNLYDLNCVIENLINTLCKDNLLVEEKFKEKFINIMPSIGDFISNMRLLYNDDKIVKILFIDAWVKKIKYNRSLNIINTNKYITAIECLEALENLIIENEENLLKTLNVGKKKLLVKVDN